MKKILALLFAFFAFIGTAICQESETSQRTSNFHLSLDLQTKYVWRGMEMMTVESAPVVFPQLNYQYKGLFAYVMGGYAINGKYAEVDLGFTYSYKWITMGINGYYYPTISSIEDQYFSFGNKDTGHWWEAVVTIAPEKMPVSVTISNFFAGADKNLDGNQAFSTYAEICSWYNFLNDHKLSLYLGAAMNKSCYNGYLHGFGVCNIEGRYTYNLSFTNGLTVPLSVGYILNPIYQKAHINFMMSFAF